MIVHLTKVMIEFRPPPGDDAHWRREILDHLRTLYESEVGGQADRMDARVVDEHPATPTYFDVVIPHSPEHGLLIQSWLRAMILQSGGEINRGDREFQRRRSVPLEDVPGVDQDQG